MPRPKGQPTKVERLPLGKARKLRWIAKKLNIPFATAFDRISGGRIDDVHRRMKAGEHVELGENGGA